MKTDKRSTAIRAAWVLGVSYVFILGMLLYLFYIDEGLRVVIGLWILGISYIFNSFRKELKGDIKTKEK